MNNTNPITISIDIPKSFAILDSFNIKSDFEGIKQENPNLVEFLDLINAGFNQASSSLALWAFDPKTGDVIFQRGKSSRPI